MPLERPIWRTVTDWARGNVQLTRLMDVLALSDRYSLIVANSTALVALTTPLTLIESTTTAGAVTLTLPDPRTVVGYRVDVVKLAGANALTVDGVTVANRAAFVSTGAHWRQTA